VNDYDEKQVGYKSDRGPVRANNQDACFTPAQSSAPLPLHLGVIYIVADGVGGQKHGADAARLATQIISEAFYRARREEEAIRPALEMAIHEANQAIYAEAEKRGGDRMGSTVVVAVQDEGKLYIAHVGDARAYLLREGELRRLTRDDTWVQKQVEAGVLTPEEAANHELRNVVTQVLGNKPEIEVHLSKPYAMQPDDVLLLCSDGLYDPVSGDEIEEILRRNEPQAAAEALVSRAIERDASDNITAVVVHHGDAKASVAVGGAGLSLANLPGWAPMAAVAFVLIVALVIVLPRFIGGGDGEEAGGETAVSLPTRDTPATVPAAAATATPPPVATSTFAPTATNTPPPTSTPLPPTSTPPPLFCVAAEPMYVWTDAQLDAGCSPEQRVFSSDALARGTAVRPLPDPLRDVEGPDPPCTTNRFRKIETIDEGIDPPITGWVLANGLTEMPPQGCPSP
jgi:protein phosphatase